VAKNFTFSNPQSPFPFAEKIVYDRLQKNELSTDFTAVKIGDVTGDAKANATMGTQVRSLAGHLRMLIDENEVIPGEEFAIPVYAGDLAELTGLQLALQIQDADWKGITAGALPITEDMYHIQGKHMLIAFNQANASRISADEVLFYLNVESQQAALSTDLFRIDEMILSAEAYNDQLEDLEVTLGARSRTIAAQGYELYQNMPNPFREYTEIGFRLADDTNWTITIFDLTGKVLKKVQGQGVQGDHLIRIESGDLGAAGILYYQLDTDGFTATRKMVRIQ
jgi:hypothetical protein